MGLVNGLDSRYEIKRFSVGGTNGEKITHLFDMQNGWQPIFRELKSAPASLDGSYDHLLFNILIISSLKIEILSSVQLPKHRRSYARRYGPLSRGFGWISNKSFCSDSIFKKFNQRVGFTFLNAAPGVGCCVGGLMKTDTKYKLNFIGINKQIPPLTFNKHCVEN